MAIFRVKKKIISVFLWKAHRFISVSNNNIVMHSQDYLCRSLHCCLQMKIKFYQTWSSAKQSFCCFNNIYLFKFFKNQKQSPVPSYNFINKATKALGDSWNLLKIYWIYTASSQAVHRCVFTYLCPLSNLLICKLLSISVSMKSCHILPQRILNALHD